MRPSTPTHVQFAMNQPRAMPGAQPTEHSHPTRPYATLRDPTRPYATLRDPALPYATLREDCVGLWTVAEPRDVGGTCLVHHKDIMLTVATGRALEAWDTNRDGEHRLHAHDMARPEHGLDVLAKLEARLAPVLGD